MRLFLANIILLHFLSLSLQADGPLIVAHRGLLRHAPENTLANFRACLELRIGFEFDVQRTKDGHLVCIHDGTVDRTTNGKGKVTELTLEQIQKLDAGSWFDPKFTGEKVPTVEDVLKLAGEYRNQSVLITVDLKAENVETDVVRLAEKSKVLNRLLFIGRAISEPSVREAILKANPKAHVAVLANTADDFPTAVADRRGDWVYLRFLPSQKQTKIAQEAKKHVFIAGPTVSGSASMFWRDPAWRYAVTVGTDGILTDYPLELRTILRQKTLAK
ncbi:MAG: glycerophosphodiester phosphodiesterase family protein [Planctomycetaceae bacterium]|nr:glycerophosphodiester phosphodiesterase family protein [Planctomycetaceae bacterium]